MTADEIFLVVDIVAYCFSFCFYGLSLFVLVDLCFISHDTRVIHKRIKQRLEEFDKDTLEYLSSEMND